ncbi:MAG: hypothetical protein RLZZ450_113 [Pseudomonadota bacterium]
MGAQLKKIARRAVRDVEALERILLSRQELNTTGERVRTALNGNTQSGMRRRAKKAIALAASRIKPEVVTKTISHPKLLGRFAYTATTPFDVIPVQTIKCTVPFKAPPVASVALQFARALGDSRRKTA